MHGFQIVIIVAFLAIFAVWAYFSLQQQLKRRDAIALLAAQRQWQFDSAKDSSHDARYGHFSIFTTGHTRYAYNTLHANIELVGRTWPVQLGDYHYQTTSSNGKQTTTHTHRFSYAIFETPYLGTPDLLVRDEGFMDKLAGMLGFEDIDFESAEFSSRFVVKSSDKRFAYDVIHPRMMEFLLDSAPPTIELRRGQCCLHRGQKCWAPEDFGRVADWAVEFFAHWPRHVTGSLQA